VSRPLALFDGDHAVLADLVEGLGHDLADFRVVVGGDGGNVGDLVLLHRLGHGRCRSTTAVTAFCMPRPGRWRRRRRPVAAAFDLNRASASTVAVVVPSPALSEVLLAASLTSWAPMFSTLSRSSISSATVTPSLVTVGPPQDLVEHGVAAARAEGALDGTGEFLDPGKQ
jgi:hypothetical protein